MVLSWLCLFLSLSIFTNALAIPDEDWGYVKVRPNANMFWWLYGLENTTLRDSSPLVIWLQGGPGASSTGYGNFEEIGPLDIDLKRRPINWVQAANILFIDSPVGTGYSYVTSDDAYVTTDKQIGIDLVALLKEFVGKYPVFQKNQVFILCESYGGKSATSFAVELVHAIKGNEINVNFGGVGLGDSWISPISFVNAWADYLLTTSEIDQNGWNQITAVAGACQQAVTQQRWLDATNLWSKTEGAVFQASDNVNFYNILDRDPNAPKSVKRMILQDDKLSALMNGQIRSKLKIIPHNVTFGATAGDVFGKLEVAFMQPIIDGVDFLLQNNVPVTIYSGNLDLICCTTATINWMKELQWSGMQNFWKTPRTSLHVDGIVSGFRTTYANLHFYVILAAGHMVPADQPKAAQRMLMEIISKKSE